MSIPEVVARLPGCGYVAVSGTLNEVVYHPVTLLRVKNPFDLSFLHIIDSY
jgi:hypothetical protein